MLFDAIGGSVVSIAAVLVVGLIFMTAGISIGYWLHVTDWQDGYTAGQVDGYDTGYREGHEQATTDALRVIENELLDGDASGPIREDLEGVLSDITGEARA